MTSPEAADGGPPTRDDSGPGFLGPLSAVLGGAVLLVFLAIVAFGLSGLRAPADGEPLVPTVSLQEVLAAMRRGEPVVFVDVREPQEYAEFHVPGAVNIPVRQIDHTTRKRFAGSRFVIAYCLKDFRGFEGAKWLHYMGVPNVRLIEGFGINAWRAAQLPLAGNVPRRTDDEALEELRQRLQAP